MRVEVGAFGYAAWRRTYVTMPSEPIRVLLSPAPIRLEGIEVAVRGRPGDPLSLSRDAFVIDSVLIRSLPPILETDVLRATAVSPSASAPSDYTSVPFVRGGTSDDTPVLLDGVRLLNAFHLGGFVSAINAEVVERATVLPGSGGDALPIGSLSGAIDIATRDGSRDRARMAGSLGLASSRFSAEGPVGESVSYLLSGRRTYIDGFTLALKKLGIIDGHLPYFFQDLHGKVTTDLGGVRRLSVSGYLHSESLASFHSRRETGEEALKLGISWGNAAFSGHYRDRFGANGIVDARLGHSRFGSDLLNVKRDRVSADPKVFMYDTLLAGNGSMSETRADLRVTWRAGRTTITAGTQAARVLTEQDHDVADRWDLDDLVAPATLRENRWRLAAYSSVEVPLRL